MSEAVPPRFRWWHLSPAGSLLGFALAVLSVTPSLLPRPAVFQGAVTAVAFSLGYLVGVCAWGVVALLLPRRVRDVRPRRTFWLVYGALWIVALGVLSALSARWQDDVRARVQMPPLDGVAVGAFIPAFLVVVLVLLAAGKGVAALHRRLRPLIGPALAGAGSAVVTVAAVTALVFVVASAVDGVYLARNGAPDPDAAQPGSTYRSAGAQSTIDWDSVGRHGADFLSSGPTAAQIEDVTGRPARTPIRVYAGLASAPTDEARAALVVSELERTGAFQRRVLVVATTTGSGWLEPAAVDAVEYLHGGDTAIAAMPYAYTPSWYSFVFAPDAPVQAARTLFDAVHAVWAQLPVERRPKLIVYGLSLGAHGAQAVFSGVDDIRTRTDGALFVGSPNGSQLWRTLTAQRDAGSPIWLPVLDAGAQVRWMSQPGDDRALPGPWTPPRVLYLQHATDPVTWLGPELLWQPPAWLTGPRAADVSPAMIWMPVITAAQVTVDMLMGESVPARHGHAYGDVMVDGWRDVTGDAALDAAAVARIRTVIAEDADIRPFAD